MEKFKHEQTPLIRLYVTKTPGQGVEVRGRMNDKAYELLGDEIVINKTTLTLKYPTIDSKRTYTVTTYGTEHTFTFRHADGVTGTFEVVDAGHYFRLDRMDDK